mgnify:CR=1 FL=1
MELEQIVELIDRVSASELDSFCLEQNGMRLSLKKKQPRKQTDPETQSTLVQLQKQSESPQEQSKQMSPVELTGTEPTKTEHTKTVVSPLVGIFYAAPAEDAEPFVQEGDGIEKGQTLGIVEAMKLMNEIESEYDGIVEEILVKNEETVEYGQPLFLLWKNRTKTDMENPMKQLNIMQIQELIPHRHPFLLIDGIEDYEPGEYAVGYKCVTYREDFFAGHFPEEPVMPGVLILEALAQTGAVAILSLPENKGKIAYFGAVDKCRFKGKVIPGDRLCLETRIIRKKGPMGIGEATASVGGKIVARAELTFMIGA